MKGIFFSFILIVTIFSVITFVSIQKGIVSSNLERLSVSTRINSMLNFYNSILYDSSKALDIISKRAMAAAINYVVTNGSLQQADRSIEELMVNGTIKNTFQGLMYNTSIFYWQNKMMMLGSEKSFDVKVNFTNVKVKPYDSWNLLVSADVLVDISDIRGAANLTKTTSLNHIVSIEGLEDPIYYLNTIGKTSNIIVKSSHIGNYTSNLLSSSGASGWFRGTAVIFSNSESGSISAVSNKNQKVLVTDATAGIEPLANQFGAVVSQTNANGITVAYVQSATNAMTIVPNNTVVLVDGGTGKVWYIENIWQDANSSYYFPSANGASFLDRLEGKRDIQPKYSGQTTNIIGMESFVNKNYLSSVGISVDTNKPNVDHLYFSNATYVGYTVKGMDSTFRIDKQLDLNNQAHDVIYGLNGLE